MTLTTCGARGELEEAQSRHARGGQGRYEVCCHRASPMPRVTSKDLCEHDRQRGRRGLRDRAGLVGSGGKLLAVGGRLLGVPNARYLRQKARGATGESGRASVTLAASTGNKGRGRGAARPEHGRRSAAAGHVAPTMPADFETPPTIPGADGAEDRAATSRPSRPPAGRATDTRDRRTQPAHARRGGPATRARRGHDAPGGRTVHAGASGR